MITQLPENRLLLSIDNTAYRHKKHFAQKFIIIMEFAKIHGAGNDFIVTAKLPEGWSGNEIQAICRRRLGIGADGLIEVSKERTEGIRMRYYNSDGGEASFCGNGARCAVYFAFINGWVKKKGILYFREGMRRFEFSDKDHISIEFPIENTVKEWREGHFIDTGSPHVCLQLPSGALDQFQVEKKGKEIRYDSEFEGIGGTNVNFFEKGESSLRMRTYERGVEAETMACGTGTVAIGLVARTLFPEIGNRIVIEARGGRLIVEKRKNFWLTGPAKMVYSGILKI